MRPVLEYASIVVVYLDTNCVGGVDGELDQDLKGWGGVMSV